MGYWPSKLACILNVILQVGCKFFLGPYFTCLGSFLKIFHGSTLLPQIGNTDCEGVF